VTKHDVAGSSMCSLSIRPLLARDCANEVILACKAAKSRTLIVLVAALLLAILVFLEALGAYLFQPIPVQWGAPAMVGLFIKSGARPRWRHSRRAGGENDQKEVHAVAEVAATEAADVPNRIPPMH
jgi:hypothetical protein